MLRQTSRPGLISEGMHVTREEFDKSQPLRNIFGTYESYRASLPRRNWVRSKRGWVTAPWPWDVG